MLHNNAAQQRPGEKPASAPKALQIKPRAQGRANIKSPTLKRPRSRPEDTNTASLTDGNMDTMHIIHIRGARSPPPQVDLMTHASHQTRQHSHGPTEILQKNFKLPTRLARDHPFGEGHEQARSVLGSEQGTEQEHLPRHATKALQQNPDKAIIKKNQLSHGIIHGRTKPTWQTPTNTPCTQLLPRHGTTTTTVKTCKTHSMKNIGILRPLLGGPDTISSGMDTGIPARSSDLCRGVSMACKFWQTRSCRCRFFTRHEKAR